MRTIVLFAFILLLKGRALSQISIEEIRFPSQLQGSQISKIKPGDSLVYYQCCIQGFSGKGSGDSTKKNSKANLKTTTDKLVVIRNRDTYSFRYYQSPQNYYPNKKFAYLKLVEKEHWGFQKIKEGTLGMKDVFLLAALETKLQEVTEYDLKVTEKNSPQIILLGRKIANQYKVSGNYLMVNFLDALQ